MLMFIPINIEMVVLISKLNSPNPNLAYISIRYILYQCSTMMQKYCFIALKTLRKIGGLEKKKTQPSLFSSQKVLRNE